MRESMREVRRLRTEVIQDRQSLREIERQRAEFLQNPESRIPGIVVSDCSSSMNGPPMEELNNGLKLLNGFLTKHDLTARRVEIAIVTFGGTISIAQDFATADQLRIPHLVADGETPMSEAILRSIEMLSERTATYNQNGIGFNRPWMFLLTDGAPTDTALWKHAVERVRTAEKNKELEFFAIGVGEEADMQLLNELSAREAARLKGLDFGKFFRWLGLSFHSYSMSRPGEAVALPPPDWMELNP